VEEYCRRQGYDVLERFHEEGESAKTTDRSQLQRLLTYCRLNKGRVHFVAVFNLARFARDKYDHFSLRSQLQSLGISLRSATEPIDDTSTGKLMEGVLAAFAQFDNDVRSNRARAGLRAGLALGMLLMGCVSADVAGRTRNRNSISDSARTPAPAFRHEMRLRRRVPMGDFAPCGYIRQRYAQTTASARRK
jgi:site-specific DNA recombinase